MDISVKIGLLRVVGAMSAAGVAIYVNPDVATVLVASVCGFTAGYFTRIRDEIRGK